MNGNILLAEDDAQLSERLVGELARRGWSVRPAGTLAAALAALRANPPDIIVADLGLPDGDGMDLVVAGRALDTPPHIVVLTGRDDMETIVTAVRAGAADYLVKPVSAAQLEAVLAACMQARTGAVLRDVPARTRTVVGRHPLMLEVFKMIGSVASGSSPVLIRGESGTGKELVARAIHDASPRRTEPFIPVNCSAFTDTLIASELFGHVRGAFTGAVASRRGHFELAGRGTLFLDEVGDTSLAFQAMLLRVLESREFFPVGAERARSTDARVLAATHRDLEAAVRAGDFREDLYYRLRALEITLPPLRDRSSDIPLLVEHVLARVSALTGRPAPRIGAALLERLGACAWPGNVRELENAVLRAATMNRNGVLSWEEFGIESATLADSPDPRLASVIRAHVRTVLERCGGNRRMCARVLGISRARLDRILKAAATERGQLASKRGPGTAAGAG